MRKLRLLLPLLQSLRTLHPPSTSLSIGMYSSFCYTEKPNKRISCDPYLRSAIRLSPLELQEKMVIMFLQRLTKQGLNSRRCVGLVAKRWHGGPKIAADAPTISVSFLQPSGETKIVTTRVGENFLQVAHQNEIDLEGACEGVCACSTCHGIFPMEIFDQLPEASEDEEDMLDMAPGLTETSRLCCQVVAEKYMDGMTLTMPRATRNFYVDGHVPKPH